MNVLILAAGRFGEPMRRAIADGREPRLDVFELATTLGADIIDFADAERSRDPVAKGVLRTLGPSAAVAYLGFRKSRRYDAVLTTGEDIGLPLAVLMKANPRRPSHTMIAHTLYPQKKQVLFRYGRAARQIDRFLVYSTSEERHAIDTLGVQAKKVERIYFHADPEFFKPNGTEPERDLICAAGQLLRDYDTLIDAIQGLPVRLQIAAGSPWIEHKLGPTRALPAGVSWGKLDRFELRELYARSALAVVPIRENDYQTGIATILEMMSMGKCVIATKTRGQTDTIRDGETGVYVPPADPGALRSAIERMLANPEEAARIGRAARKFIEENASLGHFVARVSDAVRTGDATLRGGR
ncbi:MAG TPA: glycosyltransferase family 4 protein [Polyangiaceae bacterium]